MTLDLPNIRKARLDKHLDDEPMYTFFKVFTAFEYALRTGGFAKGAAEANWDAFKKSIAQAFRDRIASDEALRASVEELVTRPPKKQRPDLSWGDRTDVDGQGDAKEAEHVLRLVHHLRNNSFHGRKFDHQGVDAERDNELVRNALVILDRAVGCNERVLERFVKRRR